MILIQVDVNLVCVTEAMRTAAVYRFFLAGCVCLWGSVQFGTCSNNLALHKPAWVSSASHDTGGPPSKAVDGQVSSDPYIKLCIHTADNDPFPWVVVDLLGEYYVTDVFIYNRQDCCQSRLHDFVIEVFHTNPARCGSSMGTICKEYTGVFNTDGNFKCDTPVEGRFVRLMKPSTGTGDVLNICDLEVYGVKKDRIFSYIPVMNGKRLNSASVTVYIAVSKIACVVKCRELEACLGVNYNPENGVCELLTHPENSDTVADLAEWHYCGHDFC